jgi:hypothetical protein
VSESGLIKIKLPAEDMPPEVPKKRDVKALQKDSPIPIAPMSIADRIALNKQKEAEKQ